MDTTQNNIRAVLLMRLMVVGSKLAHSLECGGNLCRRKFRNYYDQDNGILLCVKHKFYRKGHNLHFSSLAGLFYADHYPVRQSAFGE